MKIGFIGTGNMAKAIIRGLVSKNFVRGENINCSAMNQEALASFTQEAGVRAVAVASNQLIAADSAK